MHGTPRYQSIHTSKANNHRDHVPSDHLSLADRPIHDTLVLTLLMCYGPLMVTVDYYQRQYLGGTALVLVPCCRVGWG